MAQARARFLLLQGPQNVPWLAVGAGSVHWFLAEMAYFS